jgi:hypothetical protein
MAAWSPLHQSTMDALKRRNSWLSLEVASEVPDSARWIVQSTVEGPGSEVAKLVQPTPVAMAGVKKTAAPRETNEIEAERTDRSAKLQPRQPS